MALPLKRYCSVFPAGILLPKIPEMKGMALTGFILISAITFLSAQDRQFVRTYQSNTLPKGAKDLEAWSTWRTGRNYFYNALDTRLEFEMGLTNKLQTALYFNASHSAFGANKDTLGGIPDTAVDGIFTSTEFSVSNEWKLNVLNPSMHPVGLALYAEFGWSPTRFELENKVILDRRTDKDLLALNLVNEFEMVQDVKKGKKGSVSENEPEVDLAYLHLVKPNLGIGIEMRNSNEIEGGNWNFSALFGGPTIYYSGEKHFLILNVLPQWTNLRRTADAPGSLVLNAREKFEIRLLVGFTL